MLLRLHNEERKKAGVAPLVFHPGLVVAGSYHANDMAEKGYFSHTSKDGTPASRRIKRFYDWSTYGENIAWNHLSGEEAVRRVMTQWMGSAGHKKNILNPRFKEVGFGIADGGRRTLFVCDLGSR
ncbi:MAG: CAP domain-containing protein [Actinomycetota bacterium]|nr:CAP domain-containing protein [Actinomycetota bacterium]